MKKVTTNSEWSLKVEPRSSVGYPIIFFIIATVFIDALAFALIIPVLPDLLMDLTGGGVDEAARWGGFATAVFAVAQFFFSPVIGGLSDRFGRRPVLLMSLSALAVDFMIMGLAHALYVFFIARILSGIFAATHSTANAYITDITVAEQRATRFGWLGAAMGIGFIVGPVIGGFVGELSPRMPFYVAAGLALTNATYGFFLAPESLNPEQRRSFSWERSNPFGTLSRLFKIEGLGLTLWTYFFVTLAGMVYMAVWTYAAISKFGWGPAEISLTLSYYGLLYAISMAVLVPVVLKWLGERRAIWTALLVESIAFIGMAFAANGLWIYILITTAIFTSIVPPALQKIMTERVSEDSQGELQGGLSAMTGVIMIISPLIYTQLFFMFDSGELGFRFPGAPFLAAGMFCGVGLLCYLARHKQMQNTQG